MNKSEFIAEVAAKAGMTKVDAQKSVNAFIEVIQEQMKKGEKVALLGFGTFSVTQKAARTGINPKTKKAIKIPARKAVKFKVGSALQVSVFHFYPNRIYKAIGDLPKPHSGRLAIFDKNSLHKKR